MLVRGAVQRETSIAVMTCRRWIPFSGDRSTRTPSPTRSPMSATRWTRVCVTRHRGVAATLNEIAVLDLVAPSTAKVRAGQCRAYTLLSLEPSLRGDEGELGVAFVAADDADQ